MTYLLGRITCEIARIVKMVLEPIFSSSNKERILIFLQAREEGYAREIARFYDTDLFPIQDQLEKLEAGGVIVSRQAGRTILYQFNPRYAFLNELRELLAKALTFFPDEMQARLLENRRRPRRRGKPE
jgi:predicted transcriptional regulator